MSQQWNSSTVDSSLDMEEFYSSIEAVGGFGRGQGACEWNGGHGGGFIGKIKIKIG